MLCDFFFHIKISHQLLFIYLFLFFQVIVPFQDLRKGWKKAYTRIKNQGAINDHKLIVFCPLPIFKEKGEKSIQGSNCNLLKQIKIHMKNFYSALINCCPNFINIIRVHMLLESLRTLWNWLSFSNIIETPWLWIYSL